MKILSGQENEGIHRPNGTWELASQSLGLRIYIDGWAPHPADMIEALRIVQ